MKYRPIKESNHTKYFNRFGDQVPSVTTILKVVPKDLLGWANYIGLKGIKYNTFMDTASFIGSSVHDMINHHMLGHSIPDIKTFNNTSKISIEYGWKSYLEWRNKVDREGFKCIDTEKGLVCDTYAGTMDLLADCNGKLVLMDFKTSNYISFSMFLQLAAYAKILEEEHGIIIDEIRIIKLYKDQVKFEEFTMDNKNHIELFKKSFVRIVDAFYAINEVEYLWEVGEDGTEV